MSTPNLNIWGKYDRKTGKTHPALFHLLDSGFIAREILKTFLPIEIKYLAKNMGLSTPEEVFDIIPYMVALHDLGKFTPKFVSQIPELKQPLIDVGFVFNLDDKRIRHEVFSLFLAGKILPDFGGKKDFCALLGGHHGRYSFISTNKISRKSFIRQSGYEDDKWREQQKLAYDVISEVFPTKYINNLKFNENFLFFFSGLISQIDWISSDEKLFEFAGTNISWQQYVQKIPEKIKKVDAKIKWFVCNVRDMSFVEMFGFNPNDSQKVAIEEVESLRKPSLIIVEDSTGNGKTESAEYMATRLMLNVGHRGIHMFMPTQATANAMFSRYLKFLETVTDGKANVHLSHSGASSNSEYLNIRPKNVGQDEDEEVGGVVAEDWYSSDNRKFLAQYGDGTVDQGLMGVLPVKYFFMRLYGLANKVIVFDEVHAYDRYMLILICRLLKELGRLNCSVIILSATLPKSIKNMLVEAYGYKIDKEKEVDYPRLTIVTEEQTVTRKLTSEKTKKIKLNHLILKKTTSINGEKILSYEPVIDIAIDKIKNGGCLAIICNTVRQCQDVFESFKKHSDIEVDIIHARFFEDDKNKCVERILSKYGKNSGENRPHKSVLIGTQIVEQSLNIDFDYMIAFLSPIDLLFQRIGREWRFPETKRPIACPEVTVVSVFDEMGNLENYVYEKILMNLTYKAICDLTEIVTPDMVEGLMNEVYEREESTMDPEDVMHYRNSLRKVADKEQDATNFVLMDSNGYTVHPFQSPIVLSEQTVLSPAESPETSGPKTRDIVLSTKTVILFRKDKKWYFDIEKTKPAFYPFKKEEYSYSEIEQIKKNTCPIIGNPLYDHFTKYLKPEEWKENHSLKYLSLLIMDEDDSKVLIGGFFEAKLSYSKKIGLRTDIKYHKKS